MSLGAINAAVESSVADRTELLVLMVLAARADPKTGECWPSIGRIAEDSRLGRRAVFRVLERLVAAGHITRQIGRAGGRSKRYVVHPRKVNGDSPLRAPKVNGGSPSGCTPVHLDGEPPCTQKEREPKRKESGRVEAARAVSHGTIDLPFQSQSFHEAWTDWLQYCKELRKPLTPSTMRAQLTKLAKMGETEAIGSIHRSIERRWRGLFPPPSSAPAHPRKSLLGPPQFRLKL